MGLNFPLRGHLGLVWELQTDSHCSVMDVKLPSGGPTKAPVASASIANCLPMIKRKPKFCYSYRHG